MKIADVLVILADIPVKRPHTMSFTTLHAVNFAFVRVETANGLTGWGEAACLGGPTWSEESAELAGAQARAALGHRIFRIKPAAHPVHEAVARVKRIREAVGPDIALRVDANRGWARPTALRAIRALEPYRLDFVEQPVPK